MRSILAGATALLLWGSAVAEPTDPMQLAETGAYLLGTDPTARRQLAELDRALARLPAEQREVVLLVGLEGMAYESAAQILGVPIGTIRSGLSRGREALRELVGREDEAKPAGHPLNRNDPQARPSAAVPLLDAA
jgi:DNA-directed RNA polymerase specialized sigma24 family protein